MKALSIRHPWIDAILAGYKTVEVRSRSTHHRGQLLLHGSRTWGRSQRELLDRLRCLGYSLPEPEETSFGAVLGRAQLVECRRMTDEDWRSALVEPVEGVYWAWRLEQVEAIERFPCIGHLGLFEVETGIRAGATAAV